ncbi:MAG: hybrid sensor histidine kinase/response regulator [Caulobacteraceae bacterium]
MSPWALLAAVGAYAAILVWIAWSADRRPRSRGGTLSGVIYALSLAIFSTSYYGAVGTAARSGWQYVNVFLGPTLAATLLFPLWVKVATAAKRVNAGSIADFLAARYGRSRALGVLVTIVAVVGSLPTLGLQLRSLSTTWARLTGAGPQGALADGNLLVAGVFLAGFAILFGARRAELTVHNRGLVEAAAFGAVVKLGGFIAAGIIAISLLVRVPNSIPVSLGLLAAPPELDARLIVMTSLSALALFCVPRQFHMGFVELKDLDQVREVHRTLPIYFLLMMVFVVPVAAAAVLATPNSHPDLLILSLPLTISGWPLVLAVFLGGLAASTAVVVVEAVALSAMISNELVLPLAAGRQLRAKAGHRDFSSSILLVRRLTILGIMVMAWLYCRQANTGMVAMGAAGVIAAAQFAPALIAAVAWRRGTAAGAIAGLAAGFVVWLYALVLPPLGWIETPLWMGQGDPMVVAALWSLGLNTVLFVTVSLFSPMSLAEGVQAELFLGQNPPASSGGRAGLAGRVEDLRDLAVRFLGAEAAHRSFSDISGDLGQPLRDGDPITPLLAREVERRLAGAIGSSSAQGVIAAALSGGSRGPEEVRRLLDEAAQAVQFSRELLQSALDNVEQGISVIDSDLRLLAWNARYLELFEFPPGFIHVGKPIGEVIKFNALRGEWVAGDPEEHIARRLRNLRRRTPHIYERERRGGMVLRCVGAPMPGGRYITTFTDITEHRRREDGLAAAARALEEANQSLERRVDARTADLRVAIDKAEAANASKSRFLAAASHDLLQPLHAARLFVAALAEEEGGGESEVRRLATQADRSIAAADGLLRALLNLAKLEAGKVQPTVRPVALKALLDDLHRQFLPIALEKGLELRTLSTKAWVRSDAHLLRSMLQNLIGNAIAYTPNGSVLVGVRRRCEKLRIEVWDTGPGIPENARESIFRDFWRGESAAGASGVGLGLAIVDRVAALLDHPLDLKSVEGRGSMFAVTVPRAAAKLMQEAGPKRAGALGGLRILCVDDEQPILDSVQALVGRWGGVVDTARSYDEALALGESWSAALIDYHIGADRTGLELISTLGARLGRVALVTADTNEQMLASARAAGVAVLNKPLQPAVLRTFLMSAPEAAD